MTRAKRGSTPRECFPQRPTRLVLRSEVHDSVECQGAIAALLQTGNGGAEIVHLRGRGARICLASEIRHRPSAAGNRERRYAGNIRVGGETVDESRHHRPNGAGLVEFVTLALNEARTEDEQGRTNAHGHSPADAVSKG